MKTRNTYIALTAVFVGAIVVVSLPVTDVVRTLAAVPAVGALLGALLQIARDRIAHERSLLVLEAQNSFSVGATSHMANVAFDKHILFSEEYASEMFQALTSLFTEGPGKKALPHAYALHEIRRKWAVWLTPELETSLEGFERAIRKIGANAGLLEHMPGDTATIHEMYLLFAEVTGEKEWQGKPITGDVAVATVIGRLRKVLGIDELTLLRSEFVKRAVKNLKNAD
jgi:hypothetical protein